MFAVASRRDSTVALLHVDTVNDAAVAAPAATNKSFQANQDKR